MELTKPISRMQDTDYILRFNLRQRIEHIGLIIVFTALAVTGLLQRYYTIGPAEWLIFHMGGIETLRAVHRMFGVIFVAGFLYHLATVISDIARGKRLSMLLSRKDFTDVVDSLKYAAGRSGGITTARNSNTGGSCSAALSSPLPGWC
jgi:cytochrome b subunit of formate dehydrogenase